MSGLRDWLGSLTAGDRIAILALIVALPATVDLLLRQLSAPALKIVPPAYVEFRADVPAEARNANGVRLAHANTGERVIDASTSALHHLHAVIPITFRNDGYQGPSSLSDKSVW